MQQTTQSPSNTESTPRSITLVLSETEIKYILGMLGDRPFKEAALLVHSIVEQYNAQQEEGEQ